LIFTWVYLNGGHHKTTVITPYRSSVRQREGFRLQHLLHLAHPNSIRRIFLPNRPQIGA
jgi:hypothetical protein